MLPTKRQSERLDQNIAEAESRQTKSCFLCRKYRLLGDSVGWFLACDIHDRVHKQLSRVGKDYWQIAEEHAVLCCDWDGSI